MSALLSHVTTAPRYLLLDGPFYSVIHDYDDAHRTYGERMITTEFQRMHDMLMEEMYKLREREIPLTLPEQDQLRELFDLMIKLHIAACKNNTTS